MTVADPLVAVITLVSVLVATRRGLRHEVLAAVVWLVAGAATVMVYPIARAALDPISMLDLVGGSGLGQRATGGSGAVGPLSWLDLGIALGLFLLVRSILMAVVRGRHWTRPALGWRGRLGGGLFGLIRAPLIAALLWATLLSLGAVDDMTVRATPDSPAVRWLVPLVEVVEPVVASILARLEWPPTILPSGEGGDETIETFSPGR